MNNLNAGEKIRRMLYLQTRITMDSTGFLCIDSCRRIMEISDIYIKIRTVDLLIEIWGTDLSLCCASADSIIIEGKVSAIEFVPSGKYFGGQND